MKPLSLAVMAVALGVVVALPVHAARTWMLPSASVVEGSGPEALVSIDAAVSEDLFEFDRMALPVDRLAIVAPDGRLMAAEAPVTTKRRSSFDLKLAQAGTYRIAALGDQVMASWKAGGETRRWRGAPDALSKDVPADAVDLQVTRLQSRVETFVTRDAPGGQALVPAGAGLEAVPLGNPTDLSAGDSTRFRLLQDGKPVADADVTVIRSGNRYRYKLGELALKTDVDGVFTVTWPEAGRWWMGASVGGRGPGGTAAQPAQRASYSATFEVLPK